MAVKASFSAGILSVFGDTLDNTITESRDAAGQILVNGGAVPVTGGTPTVANTSLVQIFGQGGNDTITLNEANGALPAANMFGGAGNDTLTGGAGNDTMDGGAGNDSFIFNANFGIDTITNFGDVAANQDVIDFSTAVFANFAAVQAALHQVGADVHIDVNASNSVILTNVSVANLGSDDFRFH